MKKFNKLYYVLTFTWGLLPNILGSFVAIFFKYALKAEITQRYKRWIFIAGDAWGGLSLGNFIFMSKSATKGEQTLRHEIGHSLQNIIWGPLFLFVIGIPSAVRYWYRETPFYKNSLNKTDYDSIWFEGQATMWGNQFVIACEKQK